LGEVPWPAPAGKPVLSTNSKANVTRRSDNSLRRRLLLLRDFLIPGESFMRSTPVSTAPKYSSPNTQESNVFRKYMLYQKSSQSKEDPCSRRCRWRSTRFSSLPLGRRRFLLRSIGGLWLIRHRRLRRGEACRSLLLPALQYAHELGGKPLESLSTPSDNQNVGHETLPASGK